MPQVFISHATHDREFVEQHLAPLLRLNGVTPWYSTQDIPSAAQWEQAIRRGLHASDWFLVVMTDAAIKSEWVRAEVHWAFENRPNRIVPVLVGNCDPGQLHLRLAVIQYIDFRGDVERARDQLLAIWGRSAADLATLEVGLKIRVPGEKDEIRTVVIAETAQVGRAPSVSIPLQRPGISRIHALLKVRVDGEEKTLWLYRVSTISPAVNGKSIESRSPLRVGDRVSMADVEIEICSIAPVANLREKSP
jgi:hypothetical protein